MNQSSRTIVALFFVLCILVLAEPSHAWWSKPNNMHYKLVTLSESKLREVGLFNSNTLYNASNCPDGPHKSLEHKDPSRIKVNFCATVGMAITGPRNGSVNCHIDCNNVTDCMGRTFHYLEDLADSTHADNHIEDARKHAFDRFVKIKRDPDMSQSVKKYNDALARLNNNSAEHYDTVVKYLKEQISLLQGELRAANKKARGVERDTARDKVFVKNFALIEAGQNKLIDLYKKELAANASGICRDTPAYCKGLKKQIEQACQIKNVTEVKKHIESAKETKALNDPGCRDLRNITCGGPVTPRCERVCVQWTEKWLNVSDGRHSLCEGGVPRPPGPGLRPPKCELARYCVKSETRCK